MTPHPAPDWLPIRSSVPDQEQRVNGQGSASDDWPQPEPLQDELPPVEPLGEDLLPDSLRPLAEDVRERMQVPLDYPAVVEVLCLAGAVNRRAAIQPKAHDSGWVVVPNLWGGIVAPPGLMKSPVIQAVAQLLMRIQAGWHAEHEQALQEYAQAKLEHELRTAAWKDTYKAAAKKGSAPPARPDEEPPREPALRRLVMNDATFEALHRTLADNLAGVLVIRDELAGWLSELDRAGREGERAFFLQAWNGDTGHTIDRIERGTVYVPACCVSMLGGIQPGRLRSYLSDAVKDGPNNDGLVQRFQLLIWPDTPSGWRYVDRQPDAKAVEQAAQIFERLVGMDVEIPTKFWFAADAQELFVEWLGGLEKKIRGDELHPALAAHLAKYRSLMPSLALLFHLADAPGQGCCAPRTGEAGCRLV